MSQGSKSLSDTSLSILELFRLVGSAGDMGSSNVALLFDTRDWVNELVVETEDITILAISGWIASRQIINSSFDELLCIKNSLRCGSLRPGLKRSEENLKLSIVSSAVLCCRASALREKTANLLLRELSAHELPCLGFKYYFVICSPSKACEHRLHLIVEGMSIPCRSFMYYLISPGP